MKKREGWTKIRTAKLKRVRCKTEKVALEQKKNTDKAKHQPRQTPSFQNSRKHHPNNQRSNINWNFRTRTNEQPAATSTAKTRKQWAKQWSSRRSKSVGNTYKSKTSLNNNSHRDCSTQQLKYYIDPNPGKRMSPASTKPPTTNPKPTNPSSPPHSLSSGGLPDKPKNHHAQQLPQRSRQITLCFNFSRIPEAENQTRAKLTNFNSIENEKQIQVSKPIDFFLQFD
ncbi:hypothetical protein Ancab_017074 [Ancistrocladus abbreviatus]